MCKGIVWIHATCRHEKKFEVSPNGHCHNYRMQSDRDHHIDDHCGLNLLAQHVNTITAPLLCIECFRQVEETITTEYDDQITSFEQDHSSLFADYLVQTHPRDQKFCERQLEIIREQMEALKLLRDKAIKGFRSGQGVWADG